MVKRIKSLFNNHQYKITMKAHFFILMLAAGCMSSVAATPYYYSQGEKIPLTEVSDRMSVAVNTSTPISMSSGYSVVREIKDNTFRVLVCEDNPQNGSRSSATTFKAKLKGVSTTSIVSPCYKSESGDHIAITPYLNVKLKTATDYTLLENAAKENNLTIVSQDEFLPLWYILSVTPATNGSSLDIANKLYETGLFAEAIADFSSETDALCSYDPLVTQQWGLYNADYDDIDISICGAWSYATGRGIKIGILDQGVDVNHIDLAQNIYPLSFDTESGTSPAKLFGDHGTHCAGIAAAVRNNGIQVAGVAPDAKIVSISNSLYGTPNSRLKRADGFVWAYKNGVDVISNSWGSSTKHAAIEEAIIEAFKYGREGKGCIIVFAAGNDGNGVPVAYPANCNDKIIAVGALAPEGIIADFSQTGDKLDVVAPGVEVLSTIPNNGTVSWPGTSMACPHVAGLAALILERNPSLTVSQVSDIIEKNTKKVGPNKYSETRKNGTWNSYYGYGLIDAEKALINTPR